MNEYVEKSNTPSALNSASAIFVLELGAGLLDDAGASAKALEFGDWQYFEVFADSFARKGMSPLQKDVLNWTLK
jgi:hypothetical protein